jgi:hypothetical protein
MKEYYFPLAKYAAPAQFKTEMEQLGIQRYIYAIIDTQELLKWGLGTGDRIPRQVEGMEGWTHEFKGFAARQLRKELIENRLDIHRNDITICVRDYTDEFNERWDAYGKEFAEAFLSNRERDAILAEKRRPLLNKQVPKKRNEKPSTVVNTNLFEFST